MNRPTSIDFLHDKLHKTEGSFNFTRFYPAFFFGGIALVIYIAALLLNLVFTIHAQSVEKKVLAEQYSTLFKDTLPEDAEPLTAAREKLQKERSELKALENILPDNQKVINILDLLVSHFPDDPDFVLDNLSVTHQSITIRGTSQNSQNLDTFKNRLSQQPQFESVNLNTRAASGNTVNFTLMIKQKSDKEDQNKKK